MTDIFISYAHEDEMRIREIVHVLEKERWSIFWDRRIPAGKTWHGYIGKALSDARCVIVAWSHHSIASEWVMEEANHAKGRGVLVPVLLDSVQPPLGFSDIQAADLTEWKPSEPSPHFDQLIQDIAGVLAAKPPDEPAPPRHEPPETRPQEPEPIKLKSPISKKRPNVVIGAGIALALVIIVGLMLWLARESPRVTDTVPGATEDFDQAIRLKPDDPVAYKDRGNARAKKGDLDGAIQDFDQAIRLKPDYAVAYYDRGVMRAKKGDLNGATQDYDQAIRLKPDDAVASLAYANRGVMRAKKGDLDGAIQDFDQAIRLKPDYAVAYYDRGYARGGKGDLNGAIQDFDQAIRLKPDDALAYYKRAEIWQEKANYKAAIRDFQKYLDLGGDESGKYLAEAKQRVRDLKNKL